ncbi:MAG: hypothetical protein K1Y36_14420 [Blastocatellia bacterium]|nr:hypothetical protein [Blastocatellia bacterium]
MTLNRLLKSKWMYRLFVCITSLILIVLPLISVFPHAPAKQGSPRVVKGQ